MIRPARLAGAALGVAAWAGPALAAATPPLPPPSPVAAARAPDALPPYEDNLERLAELLGTLAFMRGLCGGEAGPDWREKMAALMEAEGTTDARRARLAGRFNRGFESYRLTYRSCTEAARTVVARALAEGSRLSAAMSRQFPLD